MMRVLIACEESGVMRRAFAALGHDAWSCDLLPARDGSANHIQDDVFEAAAWMGWDIGIFHPPCDYLTNSAEWAYGPGPYHQKVKPETLVGRARLDAREASIAFVLRIMALPFPKAVENPIGVLSTRIRKPEQIIQPHQFGDDASKATCLWLDRLPRLVPTRLIAPRIVNGKPRWGNQTDSGQNRLSPSNNRKRDRSETFPGIAAACAARWGATERNNQ